MLAQTTLLALPAASGRWALPHHRFPNARRLAQHFWLPRLFGGGSVSRPCLCAATGPWLLATCFGVTTRQLFPTTSPQVAASFAPPKSAGLAEQDWLPYTRTSNLIWQSPPWARSRCSISYGGNVTLDTLAFPRLAAPSLEPFCRRAHDDKTQGEDQLRNDLSRLILPRLEHLSCTMADLLDTLLLARLDAARPKLRQPLVLHSGLSYNEQVLFLPKLPGYLTHALEKLELQGLVAMSTSTLVPLASSITLRHLQPTDQEGSVTSDEVVDTAFRPHRHCTDDVQEPFESLQELEIRYS